MKKGIISFSTSKMISIVITLILFGFFIQLYSLEESLTEKHLLEKDVENMARLIDHVAYSEFSNSVSYSPSFEGVLETQNNKLFFRTDKGNATDSIISSINRTKVNGTILIEKTRTGVEIR